MDPRAVWGKPYEELTQKERLAVLGFDFLRSQEEDERQVAILKAQGPRLI